MFRNFVIAAALTAVAATLASITLQYRTSHNTTFWDDTERRSVRANPVIVVESNIADAVCIEAARCSNVRSFSTVSGLYPRGRISHVTAVVIGVALPLLLVYAAAFFLLYKTTRYRKSLATTSLIIGSIILASPVTFFWTAIRTGELGGVWEASTDLPIVLIEGTTAIALLLAGLWLATRTSPEEENSKKPRGITP